MGVLHVPVVAGLLVVGNIAEERKGLELSVLPVYYLLHHHLLYRLFTSLPG
jgi:hypothetical protein